MNRSLLRARWAALGAAVAVSLGGGAMWMVDAAPADDGVEFVAITPCRLFATRPAPSTVGARSLPLGAQETFTADVWGTNGNCTVPTTATSVVMNVTVLAGSATSNLTVFPADAVKPNTSNLNWRAGDGATPNAVTVGLSATGSVSFYNAAGTVQVIADIVGYYKIESTPAQVVTVAKSGGDFTLISAALASITDATVNKPYVIDVAPGSYVEPSGVDVKDYVDIRGAGRDVTIITCSCGGATDPVSRGLNSPYAVFRSRVVLQRVTISDLTIKNTGSSAYADGVQAILNVGGLFTLRNVDVSANGATNATGVYVSNGRLVLDGVTALGTSAGGAGSTAAGLAISSAGVVDVRDSSLQATGGTTRNAGLYVQNSTATLASSSASSSSANSYGIYATITVGSTAHVESTMGKFSGATSGAFAATGAGLDLMGGWLAPAVTGTGTFHCLSVGNASLVALSSACA